MNQGNLSKITKYIAIILAILVPILGFYFVIRSRTTTNNGGSHEIALVENTNVVEDADDEIVLVKGATTSTSDFEGINPVPEYEGIVHSSHSKIDNENWEVIEEKMGGSASLDKGYKIYAPKDSQCVTVNHGPPINFGDPVHIKDGIARCVDGIYTDGDSYPYGLVVEYTFLDYDTASQGFLKDEIKNGVPSDIDFDGAEATMTSGTKEILINNYDKNEESKVTINYHRYIIFDNGVWHMFTIQTDRDNTNLEIYKKVLSTFEWVEKQAPKSW